MGAIMNLDFGRCRVYKLSIIDTMTEREHLFYDFYRRGVSMNKLKRVLNKKFPLSQDVAELFLISKSEAEKLMEDNFPKNKLKEIVLKEIERFPKDNIRNINEDYLYYYDDNREKYDKLTRQIVWFENECAIRCSNNLSKVPLLKQIVLLKCTSIATKSLLEQIIDRGIDIDGKHYIFYTSSTGQMKDSEITLLEEEFWNEHKYALMCGLTEERINERGGINTGKYFAARALNISNSIAYDSGISIDDVIVVPDFKTMVTGMVNYLDIEKLTTTEKEMQIPIENMDGAGIFIPGTLPCRCQIRGGWLKGAVFPFDFHRFINLKKDRLLESHMVDAWGKRITIEEFLRAKMILTDSQLKMRKYYNSMEEYRECFKKSGLSIRINNCAHEPGEEVKVAYQAFQTIPKKNMTPAAVEKLTKKTVEYINDAKTNSKTALKMMGIDLDEKKKELRPLHACIKEYPYLLKDVHVKKILKSAFDAERRSAEGSKLIMDGMWSYICPDLFAFCEWLFLGEDEPEGLLPEGYIYNHYYDEKEDIDTVCCLRYPHLSDCEHGVRKVLRTEQCKEWFIGEDTIVSGHDLISKVLQADWDGDHICNIHDKAFLEVLDKNTYPLYYEMDKAQAEILDNSNKLNCLLRSFSNEGIGFVSNAITKIFSEKNPDINLVRILCAYNNFVIDYFKTQKSMDLKRYKEKYEEYKQSDSRLPNFFKYAKGKKASSCKKSNESSSNADLICKHVKKSTKDGVTKSKDKADDEEKQKVFYPSNLENKKIKVVRKSKEYGQLRDLIKQLKMEKKSLYVKMAERTQDEKFSSQELFNYHCCYEINRIMPDRTEAANYLLDIEYLLDENIEDKKDILWNCYGDILYKNLLVNLKKDTDPKSITVKKRVYIPSKKLQKEVEKLREDVAKELEEIEKVSVSEALYNKIMGITTRKDCVNDKYLLFIIYVLVQRAIKRYGKNNNYIRIYKNKRTVKCTRAMLDSWLESQCAEKGLKRLEKKNYIKVEELKNYTKVWFNMEIPKYDKEFVSVTQNNPLLSLFKKTKEKSVKQCENCERDFFAHGNEKTCSRECSEKLKKTNHNKKAA